VKRGQLVEADARYRRITELPLDADAPDVQHAARHTAALEQAELAPRLPWVRIEISGSRPEEVSLSVDGAPLAPERLAQALPVNPGVHTIVGTRAGERSEVIVTASEWRTENVLLRFSPPSASLARPEARPAAGRAPSVSAKAEVDPWRVGGWIAVAGGGASLIGSAIAYGVGRQQYSDLERAGTCRDDRCLRGDALDDYTRTRRLHVVTLIAGAALGGAGAAVLWLEPGTSSADPARFGLQLGLGSVGVAGRF
jgi:hypothetical protein